MLSIVAELEDAVETELSTDFAILMAGQEGVSPSPGASFAGSTPGFISLEAGSKYSRIRIRVERWNDHPSDVGSWEDVDDIPFEEVPTAGKLMLSGFDPGEVGLDVSGLGRGRAQVLARGRHRYQYNSDADVDGMEPEEWLIRLYPLDVPPNPMVGGPRRIAGGGGLSRPIGPPWLAAVLGYRSSGWADALGGSHGFYLANLALLSAGGPLTRLELAQKMARWMPPWELGGVEAESLEVPPRPSLREQEDPLARLSGRSQIGTVGDAIDAMVKIGLLLVENRGTDFLLIANPSPQAAWERLGLTEERLAWARARALENEHRDAASNIGYAVAWCGLEGLTATPRQMAIRWCTRVEDVVGGLRLLGGSGRVTVDRELGFDSEVDHDEAITLWRSTASVADR
jgi:hypothetical protein